MPLGFLPLPLAQAAIAFVSESHTTYAARTNTTVTAPAGIADDDALLLAMFTLGTGGGEAPDPTSAPSGFTEIGSVIDVLDPSNYNGELRVYIKRAASESGDYTINHAACSSQAAMVVVRGVDWTTGPQDATSTANSGTGATRTWTGLTTASAGAMLVAIGFDWADSSADISPPSGMTEQLDTTLLYIATETVAAGATGDRTNGTNSATGNPWGARLIALRPAGSTEGAVYDETVALGTTAGITFSATHAAASALSFATGMGIGNAASIEATAPLTLSVSLGHGAAAGIEAAAPLTFGVLFDYDPAASADANGVLGFDVETEVTVLPPGRTLSETMALGVGAGVDLGSALELSQALALGASVGVTATASLGAAGEFSLAAEVGASANGGLVVNGEIWMSAEFDQTAGVSTTINPTLTFAVELDATQAAGIDANSAVQLAVAAAITAAAAAGDDVQIISRVALTGTMKLRVALSGIIKQ